MGKRPGRAAAKNAAAAMSKLPLQTAPAHSHLIMLPSENTPQYDEGDDEQMLDIPTSEVGSPQDVDEENGEDGEEGEDEERQDSEVPSGPTTPVPEPTPRRRRLGRPPKNKPPGWDDDVGGSDAVATPRGRGRGRGSGFRGGGRWARRGGPSHVTQQPIDKEGNMMDVINDEVELPEDAEGEKKVSKFGHLQDGREYRCRTFTVFGRGERLYMLSTEPARCVGFRDSYLFFTKHKRLFKIIIDEDEKRDMIERELIPHSYKGRAIGIVTARSVFREFGAQIIVGGKRVIDDYEVAKAKTDGVVEGELADPNDVYKQGEAYNKNQYVAWHGASSVYHSGAPTVPLQSGKVVDGKKRKVMINDMNWMLEHAREARYVDLPLSLLAMLIVYSRFNAAIGVQRRRNLNGIYDPHTNIMQYPRTMQATHAKWIQVDDNYVDSDTTLLKDHAENAEEEETKSIFLPVKPIYSRNYMIVDTVYESAPSSSYGVPGPDGDVHDLGFNGLSTISDDIKSELPPECLAAFEAALEKEMQWKTKWGTESSDSSRRAPAIDKGLILG
jgi:chromatin structure-remodeling complex protein RSC7